MSAASVQTRVSVRWPPHPPSEPTDTIVLTGRTGHYLDLRVIRTGDRKGEVDWATAGWKEDLPVEEGEDPKSRFNALLAYYSPASTGPTIDPALGDVGQFKRLSNGDELEYGLSFSREAGRVTEYEEVWRELPLSSVSPNVVILSSLDELAWVGRIGDEEVSIEQREGFWAGRWHKGEEIWISGGPEVGKGLTRVGSGFEAVQGRELDLNGRRWLVRECTPK